MGGLYDEVSKKTIEPKDMDGVAGKPRLLNDYGLKSEKRNGNGFPSIPTVPPGDRIRSDK